MKAPLDHPNNCFIRLNALVNNNNNNNLKRGPLL